MQSDNRYAIAVFGIPEFERELVERILSLSESREHVYRIVEQAQDQTIDHALLQDAGKGHERGPFHESPRAITG